MDEITLFTELKPSPPAGAEAARLRDRARARLTGTLDPSGAPAGAGPGTGRRYPRRRRIVLGAVAVATAAAAAVVVPTVLPGGGTPALTTRAWAVEPGGDGTVRVTIRQLHDPAGLQRALRSEGVPAYVRNEREPTCQYQQDGGRIPPASVQKTALVTAVGGDAKNLYLITINRRALPAGDAVLIEASWSPRQPDVIGLAPSVMGNDRPPVCVPLPTASP